MEKSELIKALMEKDILVSPELLESLEAKDLEKIDAPEDLLILNKDIKEIIQKSNPDLNWKSFEKAKAREEQKGDGRAYNEFKNMIEKEGDVKVKFTYEAKPHKRTYNDFVSYFNHRFDALSAMISHRQEMRGVTSISRLKTKRERESVALIGMVSRKTITQNGHVMIDLEDKTGSTRALFSKNKQDVYEEAKDLVLDEIIGITGVAGDEIVFANTLTLPELPAGKELKKAPEEAYAAFLGDPHFGSNLFLEKSFKKFLAWINGKTGNDEQREMAKKVKYLFIMGDLVEGVGVYPGQEEDLAVTDIREQYALMAKYLKHVPEKVNIIIIPGNHDAGRLAEPQPALYKDFAEALWELPNVKLLSNPCYLNIESTKDFPGFDVLMYHGYSLIYYADNVPSIREKGGQRRSDLIMRFLLRRRHLAPTHTSNLYIPDPNFDPMVINNVPDFFITGHIHRTSISNYRGVTCINGSCWTDISEDQIKRGLVPQPAKVPVVNLKTRDIKIMNFLGREEREQLAKHEKKIEALRHQEGEDE